MHQLISQHGPLLESPPQTADQVIEEIDQMLQVVSENFQKIQIHSAETCQRSKKQMFYC